MTSAKGGVRRLKTPGDESRKSARFFLQVVKSLKMVNAMLELFAHPKHHGGRRSHAEFMGGAVHADPVFGQAFQAGNLVANLVVQNLGATPGDRVEARVAQARDRIVQSQIAVLSDRQNLR